MLKKCLERALLEWTSINNRLMKVRMRWRFTNITISSYAPTNDSDDDKKKKKNYKKATKNWRTYPNMTLQ